MTRFTSSALLAALNRLPVTQRYWLAYSGGRDSHVLLHSLAAIRQEVAVDIQAVYVDHGLHAQSSLWREHCQSVCAELNIVFISKQVNARSASGQSPEAAARKARYAALAALLQAGDILLTGQHKDDQAETLLLMLLRGAGPHGLAAMPECRRFSRGFLARPLLDFSRDDLAEYAHCHKLQWMDDPSNDDLRFKRNYLRHQIMPRLQAQWPSFNHTLSRSAGLCADASVLLDQLAAQDLVAIDADNGLSITGLQALDAVRQRNVLRYWCAQQSLPVPAQAHIQQIQQQLSAAAKRSLLISWPGVELRSYQAHLFLMPTIQPVDASLEFKWDLQQTLQLPHGSLSATSGNKGGLQVDVDTSRVTVRFRCGGERILLATGQHQSLKKILQQLRIAPWQRNRLPLIYIDNELAAIAGVMVSAQFFVPSGQIGIDICWKEF